MIDGEEAEADLLTSTVNIYRESSANDRVMFNMLIADWAMLSAAHRALVYQVADAFRSAAAWRKGYARDGYPR